MSNNTLFVIDLDGVIFNTEERFKRAAKSDGRTDWSIALDPALLSLDTLIEGAVEAIEQLATRGHIIYLTSRPESLHEASYARLKAFGLLRAGLICKPESEKYTKTAKWKAEEVKELATKYKDVAFVDDEPSNRATVEELELPNVTCFESLANARMAERFMMYSKMSEQYTEIALYPHLPCSMCLSTTFRGVLEYNQRWYVIAMCKSCQHKLDAKYGRVQNG